MKTVQIEVTAEDIKGGIPDTPYSCPVALAAKRATGLRVWVHTHTINIEGRPADLPDCAISFIASFDDNKAVEPFAFDIELDEEATP